MGYPATDVFDIKFIERTRQNLEEFKGTNNFTNLINNLIGLIFIPHEYNNKGLRKSLGFLNKKVSEIFAVVIKSNSISNIVFVLVIE